MRVYIPDHDRRIDCRFLHLHMQDDQSTTIDITDDKNEEVVERIDVEDVDKVIIHLDRREWDMVEEALPDTGGKIYPRDIAAETGLTVEKVEEILHRMSDDPDFELTKNPPLLEED